MKEWPHRYKYGRRRMCPPLPLTGAVNELLGGWGKGVWRSHVSIETCAAEGGRELPEPT